MEFLTVNETAQILRVAPLTVRRYIAGGRLAAVKVGKAVRIRKEALERFVRPVEPKKRERTRMPIEEEGIAQFCSRWKITELALFGSALRDDFGPDSDADLLVTFSPEARWSLVDHAAMETELSALLGRKVDLVSRRGIERSDNWIRRDRILASAHRLYDKQ